MIRIQLRFFASLREALGAAEQLELAVGTTVGAARDALIARSGAYAQVLARGRAVRCSLNQDLCDDQQVLADGDELAFFPPVTGG
jgi:sulfur-carrier protein